MLPEKYSLSFLPFTAISIPRLLTILEVCLVIISVSAIDGVEILTVNKSSINRVIALNFIISFLV